MSPFYAKVKEVNKEYGEGCSGVLCAKVTNLSTYLVNSRDINVYSLGPVVDPHASKGMNHVLVGTYRCIKIDTGYKITRITCGSCREVSVGLKSLLDCQKMSLHDYCTLHNLEPVSLDV